MRLVVVSSCLMAMACASAEQPGPKRPLPVDTALRAAPPVLLEDDAALGRWLAARLERARAGVAERVRVPLVGRPPFSGDGPPWGLAASLPFADGRAIAVSDLTSVGFHVGPDGWLGWVEGRVVDDGGQPLLEVLSQEPRRPDEAPVFRVVSGP